MNIRKQIERYAWDMTGIEQDQIRWHRWSKIFSHFRAWKPRTKPRRTY